VVTYIFYHNTTVSYSLVLPLPSQNKGNIMKKILDTISANFNTMYEVKLFLIDNERSMSWLARHCNVSPASVKGWIDLKHYPSKKHRDAIYRVTGIRL